MKKLLIVLLTLSLFFVFAACGDKAGDTPDEDVQKADDPEADGYDKNSGNQLYAARSAEFSY